MKQNLTLSILVDKLLSILNLNEIYKLKYIYKKKFIELFLKNNKKKDIKKFLNNNELEIIYNGHINNKILEKLNNFIEYIIKINSKDILQSSFNNFFKKNYKLFYQISNNKNEFISKSNMTVDEAEQDIIRRYNEKQENKLKNISEPDIYNDESSLKSNINDKKYSFNLDKELESMSDVGSDVGSEVKSDVGSDVGSDIESDVDSDIDSDVESKIPTRYLKNPLKDIQTVGTEIKKNKINKKLISLEESNKISVSKNKLLDKQFIKNIKNVEETNLNKKLTHLDEMDKFFNIHDEAAKTIVFDETNTKPIKTKLKSVFVVDIPAEDVTKMNYINLNFNCTNKCDIYIHKLSTSVNLPSFFKNTEISSDLYDTFGGVPDPKTYEKEFLRSFRDYNLINISKIELPNRKTIEYIYNDRFLTTVDSMFKNKLNKTLKESELIDKERFNKEMYKILLEFSKDNKSLTTMVEEIMKNGFINNDNSKTTYNKFVKLLDNIKIDGKLFTNIITTYRNSIISQQEIRSSVLSNIKKLESVNLKNIDNLLIDKGINKDLRDSLSKNFRDFYKNLISNLNNTVLLTKIDDLNRDDSWVFNEKYKQFEQEVEKIQFGTPPNNITKKLELEMNNFKNTVFGDKADKINKLILRLNTKLINVKDLFDSLTKTAQSKPDPKVTVAQAVAQALAQAATQP